MDFKKGNWNFDDAFDIEKASELLDNDPALVGNIMKDLGHHIGKDALQPRQPPAVVKDAGRAYVGKRDYKPTAGSNLLSANVAHRSDLPPMAGGVSRAPNFGKQISKPDFGGNTPGIKKGTPRKSSQPATLFQS